MPRKRRGEFIREVGADPRFNSPLIQKLINVVMRRGKKNVARSIVYSAMDMLVKQSNNNDIKALELLEKAFSEVVPHVEVRSRRVGGSVYQIPREVSSKRKQALALRWLVNAAKDRPDKTMGVRLGKELIEASESRGGAVRKRTDVQKMADANRAFSHYAW